MAIDPFRSTTQMHLNMTFSSCTLEVGKGLKNALNSLWEFGLGEFQN